MNIRSCAFWGIDFVQGGVIRRNLKQVNTDMQNLHPNTEKLKEILEYTIDNIPFYKNINEPILSQFPVMNKQKYLSSYDLFFSPKYKKEDLYVYTTSGSSGTPFMGYQDREKRKKHTADLLYFHGKCGWEIGDKYIFLRAWVSKYSSFKLQNVKNNVIPFDVLSLDENMLKKIIYCIKHNHVKMILGYGSALNQLADYLDKMNISLQGLKVVISDSDPLKRESRIILEKHLGCPIVDRYSNEEHGLIAFSYGKDEPYEVNISSYFVELLKLDSNEYAEPGELARVVITDLYNKAMPLIRYEIGDLAVSDEYSKNGVKTLRVLEGRAADMLVRKNGIRISSASVNNYMERLDGLLKYQLVQNDIGKFELYVVEDDVHYLNEEYRNALSPCIGEDSELLVFKVKSIKSESTGKFKTFISNCKLN